MMSVQSADVYEAFARFDDDVIDVDRALALMPGEYGPIEQVPSQSWLCNPSQLGTHLISLFV
jgi:hypothetical protein